MTRWMFSLLVALAFAAPAQADIVHIDDGDCAALQSAIAASTADLATTIVLARGGTYHGTDEAKCLIDVRAGHVVIEGSGATLSSESCGAGGVYVDTGASLTLRDANVRHVGCSTVRLRADVINSGTLELVNDSLAFGATDNIHGAMTLRNVTATSLGYYGEDNRLHIWNSTLFEWIAPEATVLSNSVFASSYSSCADMRGLVPSDVQSLGGNVFPIRCDWMAASDRVAADAGLDVVRNNGGFGVLTAAPLSTSVTRNLGIAKYCEPTDARGIARPAGACDAGAAEFDEAKSVARGGMNGTFHDRSTNGHYVTLQRVHDDGTALVIWDTFDRSGAQAWVYGVGRVDGRHLHAEMSQNLGGALQSGGAPTGSRVHAWGTIDIDLASCSRGTLSYSSPLAAFGSGSFPLDRLAYVSDFGCVD